MDCPVCKNAMITLELFEVEIDYCTGCLGIWLDAGELELLLEDSAKAEQMINSFHVEPKCSEKPRKCPICSKKMEKIIIGLSEDKLLIDRCPKADGLWFDKGELKETLQAGTFDEDNKVVNLLTEMFAED